MLTVEQAQQRILEQVKRQPEESLPLSDCYGRVLARGVTAGVSVPPWNNSAMDGYAVRAADTSESEVTLQLLEMVGAGSMASMSVEPGTAIGVMTGAPVPQGADAVMMVENTDGAQQGSVTLRGRVVAGQHIRRMGEDIREGDEVLEEGEVLTPGRVGLASSLGHTHLQVRKRPTVAVLTTGDEVVAPGTPLQPGQIWGSNSASLCGLVHQAGGVPLDLGNAPDEPEATVSALRQAVAEADVVVTTGGVSVGAYDFVRDAIAEVGGRLDFWKVKMKPGKPLAFGYAGEVPLFGLPGNPVSCMVNFLQFVRPWIRSSLGDRCPFLPVMDGVAGEDFRDRPGRARLIRVILRRQEGQWLAYRTGSQSSGVLTSMARAHGLLLVGVDDPPPKAGERVRVQLFDTLPAGASADYGW